MPTSDVTPSGLAKASAMMCSDVGLGGDVLIIRPDRAKVDSRFLAYAIRYDANQVLSLVRGSTVYHLYAADMRQFRLQSLPIAEQAGVADALGDADALVAILERLIAKKRDIKQGMMQCLLTGRSRLPGFRSEWSHRVLGDIANVTMGQSPSGRSYNVSGRGLPLIQGNADIRERRTFDRVWTTDPTKRVRAGEVVMTVRAPVGYTGLATRNACLGRGVCGISAGESTRFLFHSLVFKESEWTSQKQGSTFTSVNSNQVRSFEIHWPDDVDERVAISRVIDDAEDEIHVLKLRLESSRAIKRGMMQQLLTGRTRLPVGEAAV